MAKNTLSAKHRLADREERKVRHAIAGRSFGVMARLLPRGWKADRAPRIEANQSSGLDKTGKVSAATRPETLGNFADNHAPPRV